MPRDPLQPMIITTRRKRPRRRVRIRVLRLFGRAALYAAFVASAAAILSWIASPYALERHQKEETSNLNRDLARTKEENRSLKHRIELLRSGEGLEEEARRLGYVKKGEIPIRVTIIDPPARKG